MNNEGDFFIGNKRVSSSTGQEKTFDAPVPTVTGEDPSRLSVVFDEVVIKERLKVEGGTSRTILSNFDGPVNFSKDVRFDAITNFSKTLTLSQGTQSQSITSGDLVVAGGVGIGKSVYIGGDLNVTGTVLGGNLQFGNIRIAEADDNTIDTTTGSLMLNSVSGITSVRDNLQVDNNLTVDGNVNLGNATSDATTVSGTLAVQSTTNSTSKTTGAVVVSGGVGINNDLHVGGDITAFSSSDQNLKQNLNVIPNAIDKVNAIAGYTFQWKETSDSNVQPHAWAGELDTGVIAQEIEALGLPGITTTREDGVKAVRYEKLVPLLIQAIKELDDKVNSLS